MTGQSHTVGSDPDPDWSGELLQAGVRLRVNGTTRTDYAATVGPQPYMLDLLLAAGITAPTLDVRGDSGAEIATVIDTYWATNSFTDGHALGAQWQEIWLLHGGASAQTQPEVDAYLSELERFYALVSTMFPNMRWLIFELQRDSNVDFPFTDEIRAIQVAFAAAHPSNVIWVPTRDHGNPAEPALPLIDGIHNTPGIGGGYDLLAQRGAAYAGWAVP
jgi:hypothetical protein